MSHVNATPSGYSEFDLATHALESGSAHASDPRNQFSHDRDRILYSQAFANLAGKSQVVSAGEIGSFHTRLTHSLKVEQVGRRMAEKFCATHDIGGPDPELVSAACLAHDIGHPPFGHAGEVAMGATLRRLAAEAGGSDGSDGFEGNAQNLRILTYLEVRKRAKRGLHLSRATLDATLKYPWGRGSTEPPFTTTSDIDRDEKFGIYMTEAATGIWILEGRTTADRPVEEQIMDWADDVTYACHDLADFYRAGVVPLVELLRFDPDAEVETLGEDHASLELNRFLSKVEDKWMRKGRNLVWDDALRAFFGLKNLVIDGERYTPTFDQKVKVNETNSSLITELLNAATLVPLREGVPLTRYNARLEIADDKRLLCNLLKELIWVYVIENPKLATQQHGQTKIIGDLLTWHADDWKNLLPPDRKEEAEEGKPLRTCADHISSLTEAQAVSLHRRMSGTELGSFSDDLI